MNKLNLLIVDDAEDNRLVLKAVCKKLDTFHIKEAEDGVEAVKLADSWHPHIILMDIMMPNMDGFEASKLIKEKYPETVIMAITAMEDEEMENKMYSIGVENYIHKPIDRDLIRFKLQSIAQNLRVKLGKYNRLSTKQAINPFNSDIRCLKRIFDISYEETMMDFGTWLYDQYHYKSTSLTIKYDTVVELFYKLMIHEYKNGLESTIIVEEASNEFYITLEVQNSIDTELINNIQYLTTGLEYLVDRNRLYIKLVKVLHSDDEIVKIQNRDESENSTQEDVTIELPQEVQQQKDIKVLNASENTMLRQNFAKKTTAKEYIEELGGDILEELTELSGMDEEWNNMLGIYEQSPTAENMALFTDKVLNIYINLINNLFEFTALAYSLSTLSIFLTTNAEEIAHDREKVEKLVMLLEHLGEDLYTWKEHLFVLQDTLDIHYLDSSFFSSCVQIESIILNQDLDEDDGDLELF